MSLPHTTCPSTLLSPLLVETLEEGMPADRAGVQVGDLLQTYDGRPLHSPAVLQALEENTLEPERITLWFQRNGALLELSLPTGKLGIGARPRTLGGALDLYAIGRTAHAAGRREEAAACWREAARQAPQAPEIMAWLYAKAGTAWENADCWHEASEIYALAWNLLTESHDTAARALLARALGRCAEPQRAFESAVAWYERAQHLDELAGRPIWLARDLNHLGNCVMDHGDLPGAQDYFTRALQIRERLVPGTLIVAYGFHNLAEVARLQGNFRTAREWLNQALPIKERLAPDSLDLAYSLNTLGLVAKELGDLQMAQDVHRRTLQITERVAPDSLMMAATLSNLGSIASERGDLAAAEDYHLRDLQITERLDPDSLGVATSLNNLGNVAHHRGELTAAEAYLTRALQIKERLAPGSLSVAITLANLGSVADDQGEREVALASLARALTLQERLAPDSLDTAMTLFGMGRVLLRLYRHSEALNHCRQSVEIVDRQREQIDATEARALLMAQHTEKYAELLRCHLNLGDTTSAFNTLERARARSLLELLADRRLDLSSEAAPEQRREQQELDRQRAEVYSQLPRLTDTPENADRIEAMHRRLRDLERRQQGLAAQIRSSSPRYAALQYPQPIDLQTLQAALDPGTVLLTYLVAEGETFLFAVTPTSLESFRLPIGHKALQGQVGAFLQSLDVRLIEHDANLSVEQGRALYQQLLAPAAARIRAARRLLLCPDGPLWSLPFGALVANKGRSPRYLGVQKPLHTTVSSTLYVQTRNRRRADPAAPHAGIRRILAFGDPLYGATAETPVSVPSVQELTLPVRGLSQRPLPHTRAEVEAIRALFGEAVTVKLGTEATPEAVIEESAEAEILHIACHGWFAPMAPLASGLLLSRTKEQEPQSGLLQAWEILARLRVRAELVVLSACRSGLGQEVRGEGLIGLTRAFQYAGAQTLAVSLWEVQDESTSAFMHAFYGALKEGRSKDEALWEAAKRLQADPRWSSPFYWSAFVLVGDRI